MSKEDTKFNTDKDVANKVLEVLKLKKHAVFIIGKKGKVYCGGLVSSGMNPSEIHDELSLVVSNALNDKLDTLVDEIINKSKKLTNKSKKKSK